MNDLKDFVEERNEALFSLKEEKIRAYAKKYNISLPQSKYAFWKEIYLALSNIPNVPERILNKAVIKAEYCRKRSLKNDTTGSIENQKKSSL